MKQFIGLIFLLLCACKQELPDVPADIIPMDKMKTLLTEMHVADAIAETKAQGGEDEKALTRTYTNQVLKNNGTTYAEFMKSFAFYQRNPALLNRMYDEILAELSKREEQAGKK
jgi:hypothetical protein